MYILYNSFTHTCFSSAVKEVKILQTLDPAKREEFLECKFKINIINSKTMCYINTFVYAD